jgi:hypothetical protein
MSELISRENTVKSPVNYSLITEGISKAQQKAKEALPKTSAKSAKRSSSKKKQKISFTPAKVLMEDTYEEDGLSENAKEQMRRQSCRY